jgi:hypothetical protein
MMTTSDLLNTGMKVWERLKPGLILAGGGQGSRSRRQRMVRNNLNTAYTTEAPNLTQTAFPPTLQKVVEQVGPIPPYNLLMGVCEDGIPLLLDLYNPAPGSMLLLGDVHSGKAQLLNTMLISASELLSPDQVAYYIFSSDPGGFVGAAQAKHCRDLRTPDGPTLRKLITMLLQTVEDRRYNQKVGPAIILVLDDLAAALPLMDKITIERFHRLIKHGPRSQVWVLATLASDQFDRVAPPIIAAFRSHFFSRIASETQAAIITGFNDTPVSQLEAGYQFCVPFGEQWVPFWRCEPTQG